MVDYDSGESYQEAPDPAEIERLRSRMWELETGIEAVEQATQGLEYDPKKLIEAVTEMLDALAMLGENTRLAEVGFEEARQWERFTMPADLFDDPNYEGRQILEKARPVPLEFLDIDHAIVGHPLEDRRWQPAWDLIDFCRDWRMRARDKEQYG